MNELYRMFIMGMFLGGISTEYQAGKPVIYLPMNVMYFKQVGGEPSPMPVTGPVSLVEGVEGQALYLENPGDCMEPAKSFLHLDYLLTDNQCLRSIAPCWIGYTVAAWFKILPEADGHFEGGYIAQMDSYLNFSLALWENNHFSKQQPDHNFILTLDTYGAAGKLKLKCPILLNTTDWAHLAFTANESISEKTDLNIYFNGQQVLCEKHAVWSNTTLPPYMRRFNIGCSQMSSSLLDPNCYCGFNGYIDELRFYDQELPPAEVDRLHQKVSKRETYNIESCRDHNCSLPSV